VDPEEFGSGREDVRRHLEVLNVESRPVWKPLHLQPVFAGCHSVGGVVAEGLFEQGLCLPSGSQMTPTELGRVVEGILTTPRLAAQGSVRSGLPSRLSS
jgi:pyridoxal phosphate-dependent aminotransferase EpsN